MFSFFFILFPSTNRQQAARHVGTLFPASHWSRPSFSSKDVQAIMSKKDTQKKKRVNFVDYVPKNAPSLTPLDPANRSPQQPRKLPIILVHKLNWSLTTGITQRQAKKLASDYFFSHTQVGEKTKKKKNLSRWNMPFCFPGFLPGLNERTPKALQRQQARKKTDPPKPCCYTCICHF